MSRLFGGSRNDRAIPQNIQKSFVQIVIAELCDKFYWRGTKTPTLGSNGGQNEITSINTAYKFMYIIKCIR